jgi:hypothetical protein
MENNEKLNDGQHKYRWGLTLLAVIVAAVVIYLINRWVSNQFILVGWHSNLTKTTQTYSAGGWEIFGFHYIWVLIAIGAVFGLMAGYGIGSICMAWTASLDLKPIKAALADEKERVEENLKQNEIAHYRRIHELEKKEQQLKSHELEITQQYEQRLAKERGTVERLQQENEACQQENERFEIKLQKAIEERTRIKKKNKQTKQKIQKMQKIEQLQKRQRGDNEKKEKQG